MALPKPDERAAKEFTNEEKEYFLSFAHEAMTADERLIYSRVSSILRSKMKGYDHTVDIKLLIDFCLKAGCKKMTEMWARRMINKFEYDNCKDKTFIIINGSESWQRTDAIRSAKIQGWMEGKAEGASKSE